MQHSLLLPIQLLPPLSPSSPSQLVVLIVIQMTDKILLASQITIDHCSCVSSESTCFCFVPFAIQSVNWLPGEETGTWNEWTGRERERERERERDAHSVPNEDARHNWWKEGSQMKQFIACSHEMSFSCLPAHTRQMDQLFYPLPWMLLISESNEI